MTGTRIATFALAGALFALVAGCGGKGGGPTGPLVTITPGTTLAELLASAYPDDFVPPLNLDLTASLLLAVDVSGVRTASALMLSNSTLVYAGPISVHLAGAGGGSEFPLDTITATVSQKSQTVYTTFRQHPLGIALVFDGTAFHRTTVTGSADFPAFVDSVRSVAPVHASAPASGANVSRAADLTVTWTPMGSDTTVYVACGVASRVGPQSAIAALARDVDGAATVRASALAGLPAGAARVGLARYRLVYHPVGTRKVGLASESVEWTPLTLN